MLAFKWPKNHEIRGLQQNFCVNLLQNTLNQMHPITGDVIIVHS